MIIRHKDPSEPKSHEITPESVYLKRRELMALGGLAGLFGALPGWAHGFSPVDEDSSPPVEGRWQSTGAA